MVKNPITDRMMPVLIVDTKSEKYANLYEEYQTCKLAVPTQNDVEKALEMEAFGENSNSENLPHIDAEFVISKAR
uniref:Uncharacterized protein n=1 Tax=Romanomermis culicivorax TaxID=13658 RepID=A0A915KXZ6_ROMCU